MMTKRKLRGILLGVKFLNFLAMHLHRKAFGKVDDTMKSAKKKIISLWLIGLGLFALRFAETRAGFDAATGLAVPTSARPALIVAVLAAAVCAVMSAIKCAAERRSFDEQFAAPEKSKILLVLASFLYMGGGVWLGIQTVTEKAGIAPLVTAVLAVVSGCGFLLLTKRMGDGEADSVAPLLPGLFFSAFWMLSLYLPTSSDPVLARYWLPILAAAMQAYALAQLSGFFRKETKPRSFAITAQMAVMLCLAAMAEPELTFAPLFLGSALLMSAFLALERE